jgi:hypothetical protein
MTRLSLAVSQIRSARAYTQHLLNETKPTDWYRMAQEGVTHLAWQVGHLAVAEYRLAIERIRGREPADEQLISDQFLMRYGRGSIPEPDPGKSDDPQAIRTVFDRVHDRVLWELERLPEEELDRPPLQPHRLFKTKIGSLWWCSLHEMLHAGQIGLLRRLLGYDYFV